MAAEQARRLEADRVRIRQEEQQRADAEAREKLAQANAAAQAGIAEGREAGALSAPLLDDPERHGHPRARQRSGSAGHPAGNQHGSGQQRCSSAPQPERPAPRSPWASSMPS
ncbi:hypothetical protein [Delftia sp.]|uniref:hypothetical protein n=1 Tax=Delftia sp. TaxID=1886637 RepID=UPI00259D01A8|nr:hypothetical protein [Delftia sp.]